MCLASYAFNLCFYINYSEFANVIWLLESCNFRKKKKKQLVITTTIYLISKIFNLINWWYILIISFLFILYSFVTLFITESKCT